MDVRPAEPSRVRDIGRLRVSLLRPEIGSLVGMALVLTVVGVFTHDKGFFTPLGISTVASVASHIGIVATAVTLLLIAGEFDLSVGGMIAATTMIAALLLTLDFTFWVVFIVVLAFALFSGLFHALLIVRLGFSSFIVTLGSGFLFAGIANYIYSIDWVRANSLEGRIEPSPLVVLLTASPLGISAPIWWWILIAGFGTYVLTQTSFGNWIYATGSSPRLARATGTPASRVKTILFVATSVSAAFLAMLDVAEFSTSNPGRGMGAEFEALIGSALGGGALSAGYGSPIGTVFGVTALAAIRQGLYFAGASSEIYNAALGVLLLAIVMLNDNVRRRALRIRR